MSEQLTYESVLEMIREGARRFDESLTKQRAEFDRAMKESATEFDQRMKESAAEFDRRSEKLDKKISDLGDRIGEIVENMVAGNNIIRKFQALDYKIERHSRNICFGHGLPEDMQGEIDLLLEDGDIAILVEVKTTLRTSDVRNHILRLEKYRRRADVKGDKRRFIGAVAGAVVKGEAEKFAHENGMYVIVQSGEAVEILPVPEGFQAKEW